MTPGGSCFFKVSIWVNTCHSLSTCLEHWNLWNNILLNQDAETELCLGETLARQSEADKGKEKADRSIESDEDFEVINLPRPKSVARVRGRGPLTRVDTYGAVFSTFDVDTGWIGGCSTFSTLLSVEVPGIH